MNKLFLVLIELNKKTLNTREVREIGPSYLSHKGSLLHGIFLNSPFSGYTVSSAEDVYEIANKAYKELIETEDYAEQLGITIYSENDRYEIYRYTRKVFFVEGVKYRAILRKNGGELKYYKTVMEALNQIPFSSKKSLYDHIIEEITEKINSAE